MGDSDKLMDVESGQKEAYEEELPSDDEEGGKVCLILFSISSFKTLALRLDLPYTCVNWFAGYKFSNKRDA